MLNKISRNPSGIILAAGTVFSIFAALPAQADVSLQKPFGIAVNPAGGFYVAEIEGKRISRFDSAGNFAGEIKNIAGYGDLQGPMDVDISASGNIYIADALGNSVLMLGPDEKLKLKLGTGKPTDQPGGFFEPHMVAADETRNHIYVADTRNFRVQIFDMTGKLLKYMGKEGPKKPKKTGTFHYATGIAYDKKGNLYATSCGGSFINVYNPKWELTGAIGQRGEKGEIGTFHGPYSIAYDKGTIWVSDSFNHRLVQIDMDGKFLKVFGGELGRGVNQFYLPADIELDSAGNIYVADWKNDRVVKLNPQGKFVATWGEASKKTFVAMWCGPNLTKKDGEWIQWAPESPKDVQYFVDRCAHAGINRVYPSMGDMYDSKVFEGAYQDWDPLAVLVKAAHEKGIEVHPYQSVFLIGPHFGNFTREGFYKAQLRDGTKSENFLSPGYEDIRAHMVEVYMELLEKYDVDGIMLDYIRFSGKDTGFDPPIIDAFEAKYKISPYSVKKDDPRWVNFRAEYVTTFIRELRAAMKAKNIHKPVSVSTICHDNGTPQVTLADVQQDIVKWAKEGLVDYICPMAYEKDLDKLALKIGNVVKGIKAVNPQVNVFGSVAPYKDTLCTPEQFKAGVRVVLEQGADGVCIYRGSSMEKYNLWNACKEISKK